MFEIRKYNKETDFDIVDKWWKNNGTKIWKDLLPETTYIVWDGNIPIVSACLYLMNSPRACMIENLIGNPDVDKEKRRVSTSLLVKFLEKTAKDLDYKNIVIFASEEKLKTYYLSFGYIKTLDNITTFAKELDRE